MAQGDLSLRTREHARHAPLEAALADLNEILASSEDAIWRKCRTPKFPVVFIVGVGRSGTTLILQWLAGLGRFAYPSNILSRFYGAPAIGARIQEILTTHDLRGELLGTDAQREFVSNLGKTKGPLSPNEFWYFWRRFFQFGELCVMNPESIAHARWDEFRGELAAIETVFRKPLAMKGMIMNWHLPLLHEALSGRALFIHVCRDAVLNAQSLLAARERFFGTRNEWYSFKPPEFEELRGLNPLQQVAAQVHLTNRAIEDGLGRIPAECVTRIAYEEFCASPRVLFDALRDKLAVAGVEVGGWSYAGPNSFDASRVITLAPDEEQTIRETLERFRKSGSENK